MLSPMKELNQNELDKYAKKILEDYDSNNPGTIFKTKLKLSNDDALLIQAKVSKLRVKRGEKVLGYKIGCVAKETQKKWVSINLPGEHYGKVNYTRVV